MTQRDPLPLDFLANHWQRQAYFARRGIESVAPVLSADELAWLATQDDVESRLVLTHTVDGATSYRLESGPFPETRLSALPEQDWTLLVQDVDKHLPDFRAHFTPFACVPDWRIDDLMISVAAPGGSVGPHVDNYDVFLVQECGIREWRLTDLADSTPDTSTEGLSLRQAFAPKVVHTAANGDVLYLPPSVPHWGVATEFCMTYSIGLRAPSQAELLAGAARVLGSGKEPASTAETTFYSDADLQAAECAPGMIHAATIRRLREQRLLDDDLDDEQLAMVFGAVVTDPKAWLMPDPLDNVPEQLRVHGMARLAWYDDGDIQLVFANGAARRVTPAGCSIVRTLCTNRAGRQALERDRLPADDARDLLEWLRLESIFDGSEDIE